MMYLSLAIPCGVGGTLDPPIPRVPRQQRGLIGKDLAEGLNLPPLEGQLMEQRKATLKFAVHKIHSETNTLHF